MPISCISLWHPGRDSRARAVRGTDLETAPEGLDPLAHGGEAEARAIPVEARAVVLDRQAPSAVVAQQPNLRGARLRMAADIGEGLLRDPVQGQRALRIGQCVGSHLERDWNSRERTLAGQGLAQRL